MIKEKDIKRIAADIVGSNGFDLALDDVQRKIVLGVHYTNEQKKSFANKVYLAIRRLRRAKKKFDSLIN